MKKQVAEFINNVNNGVFFRVNYKTELPIIAAKKDCVKIEKFSSIIARTGINYKNMKSYVEPKTTIKRKNNYIWVTKNKIKCFVLDSYFNKNSNKSSVMQVNLDNIISVN